MMSGKTDFIVKYGKDAYEKRLAQRRAYYKVHKEQENVRDAKWREMHPVQAKVNHKKWRDAHPERVIANNRETSRKGGRYYDQKLEYMQTGIPGERHKIRNKHRKQYKPYKDIIAPDSQIHHAWRRGTADYDGVALVEADQHMHGIIDVIQILEGEITLFTEKELREQEVKNIEE